MPKRKKFKSGQNVYHIGREQQGIFLAYHSNGIDAIVDFIDQHGSLESAIVSLCWLVVYKPNMKTS